jgi:hypothetical protein
LANLSAAAQSAQLLSLPLLRAAARADQREMGDSIAAWADMAEQTRSACEELQDERARRIDPNQLAGPLDQARDRARRTAEGLEKAIRLDQATAIRNDVRSAIELSRRAEKATGADRDRLRTAASRLRDSVHAAAQEAHLNPAESNGNTPELDGAINDAMNTLRSNPPIDFAGVANDWSGRLRGVSSGNLLATRSQLELIALAPRLAMASQVEMVRPDADFVRSRDLLLAARAAKALATVAMSDRAPAAAKQGVNEYPGALRDLQAEHQLHRQEHPPGNAKQITAKAQAAREKMRRWAGDDDPAVAQGDHGEQLALDAAAAQQKGEFDKAKSLDQKRAALSKSPLAKSQQKTAERETAAAQRLDSLRQRQQELAEQTADAVKQAQRARQPTEKDASQKQLDALARKQQALAKQIEAERELAQKDGDESDAPINPAAAIAQARQALTDLKQTNEQVRHAPDDATRAERAKEVDPSAVQAANEKLDKISPAADEAHAQIEDKVVGGARQLQQEARGHDANAVHRRADELDSAIADAMKKVDAAEEKLADRDALAAAESAAKEASDQLQQATDDRDAEKKSHDENAHPDSKNAQQANANGKAPPAGKGDNAQPHAGRPANASPHNGPSGNGRTPAESMAAAQQAQARTLSALERAVDRATMTGGQARVRQLPLVESIFTLLPVLIEAPGSAGGGASPQITVDLPSVREWGRLRPRDKDDQTAVATPTDPPGYEQSLRMYFEALGKEK